MEIEYGKGRKLRGGEVSWQNRPVLGRVNFLNNFVPTRDPQLITPSHFIHNHHQQQHQQPRQTLVTEEPIQVRDACTSEPSAAAVLVPQGDRL